MENNRDFIKGGLPLGSKDFVNQDNVREKKSRLLAALDNINKVHDAKMSEAITDNSYEANNAAIDNTLNMMNEETTITPAEPIIQPTVQDNYVTENNLDSLFSNVDTTSAPQYNNPSPFDFQPAVEPVQQDVYQPFDSADDQTFNPDPQPFTLDESAFDDFETPQYDNNGAQDFDHSEYQQQDVQSSESQGNPELVLSDTQVGKRAKGKSKSGGSSSADAGKSRFIAWTAYILFFIPLLFAGKNKFVRHHANEGLCVNILDVIGVGLYLLSQYITHENQTIQYVLTGCGFVGILLIALTVFSRIFLIIGTLMGKETEAPLFGKIKFIK